MTTSWLAALAALFAPVLAAAQPVAYTIEKIAFVGDPAPGGGSLHFLFFYVDLDEDGHVVFYSYVDHGPGEDTGQIVALHDGTSLQTVLRNGDLLQGGAGVLLSPGDPRIRSGGALAWLGVYSHDFTFHAKLAVGGSTEPLALFLSRTTGLHEVMRSGSQSPVGGAFIEPWFPFRPGLAGDGTVVVWSELAGAIVPHGLFRWSPGSGITPQLLPGNNLEVPNGGVIEFIGQEVSMNAQGVLCAGIDFLPPGAPFSTGGIYALDGAQHREVIRVDDPLPGSGRDFRGQAGSTPAVINASGAVVFSASIESETHSPGVYVSRGGVLTKLALNGEAAPGVPGATFTDFDHIEMNDASQIAFLG